MPGSLFLLLVRSYPLSAMNDLLANPITWIVFTAVSEIIGMSKLKDNSIIQLVLRALMQLKPKKAIR